MTLEELLGDDARVVIRPLDDSIPFEANFVRETCTKARLPAGAPWRDWQDEHEPAVRRYMAALPVLVATIEGPAVHATTSVVLAFSVASAAEVRMVYVKRDFRGYGLGLRLLTEAGAARGGRVVAQAWRPNVCWARWTQSLMGKLAKANRAVEAP